MAHGITDHDTITYNEFKGAPWHGIGVPIKGLGTLEQIQKAAPQVFSPIEKHTCQTPEGIVLEGKNILVFNGRAIGIVGGNYRVAQNLEIMKIVQDVQRALGDAHGAIIETLGTLHGGSTFFTLLDMQAWAFRVKDDKYKAYCLITDGKGNGKPMVVTPTSVRVVCQNTVNLAQGAAEVNYRFRHNQEIMFNLEATLRQIAGQREAMEAHAESLRQLSSVKPTEAQAREYLTAALTPGGAIPDDGPSTRVKNAVDRVMALWETGVGIDARDGYGLFNAFTEYLTHGSTVRKTDSVDSVEEARFVRSFMTETRGAAAVADILAMR